MADYTRELKIAEILVRQELGELSDKDREDLASWLEESEEHVTFYKRLSQNRGAVSHSLNFDAERFVQEVYRKIRYRRKRHVFLRVASVAAVLFIGLFFAFLRQQPVPVAVHTDESTLAERTLAVLSLPGGKQVDLVSEEGQDTAWMRYVSKHRKKQETASAAVAEMKIDVARGGEYRVCLEDGTMVWLNSESSLAYPEKFIASYRMVRLTGEAYFEVKRDEERPFVVSVNGAEIRVLGTSFNVAAYRDENRVTTTLIDGCVEVASPIGAVTLAPGFQAVVEEGNPHIAVAEVDADLFAAWTKGVFKFDKMSLRDICARLSRWYDVDFVFEGDCGEEKFTGGTWKYVSLEDFLTKIERVTDVVFCLKNDTVIVSPKR